MLHPANPKPTRKTHKKGPDGEMINPVPARIITVGCGTPVHNLSKVCAEGIKHLVNPTSLPRNNKSTAEVLKRVIFNNDNYTPLPPDAALALADIKSMYPSVDCDEALLIVKEKLEKDPSPLGMSADFLTEGLKLCISCNCVQFKGKFYIPCKGCAQGPCHACDFTDIWIGSITDKHIESSNVDSVLFSIYRDDAWDILNKGKADQPAFQQELDSLHPNLEWDLIVEKEGGYLDLFLQIVDGKIEWRTFAKTPPLYLSKISCYDPSVFKSIPKGVGYRVRVTNSKTESFKENVELYSKALAVSEFDYQSVKKELLKFEHVDPKDLIKRPSNTKKTKPGPKIYFNSTFDPRLPHPRKIISRNYATLAKSEAARKLFPRENLIASSKRLPNLGEMLSPTIQPKGRSKEDDQPRPPAGGPEDTPPPPRGGGRSSGRGGTRGRGVGRGRGRGGSQTQYPSSRQAQAQDSVISGGSPTPLRGGHEEKEGPARRRQGGVEEEATGPSHRKEVACEPASQEVNGTYHCEKFKSSKCDVCSHMIESRSILSSHFKVKHSIAGHNTHLPASQKLKTKWFVYLEECKHP